MDASAYFPGGLASASPSL
ncbi:BgTH12-06345 [Blumeria graminis f. sp. triticale]|uniref:BgTH12-06345 n=1 Tax=Blumeria graminis f. sp. triticale TaxID=1689686 RepID=A0A9W4DJ56_BLUGR|nr:BgTH12-06345 [Blumeria graminis f. sp. triticale]